MVHLRNPSLSFRRRPDDALPAHALASAQARILTDFQPRCLDMITAPDVIRAIERYYEGGVLNYLNATQAAAAKMATEEPASKA